MRHKPKTDFLVATPSLASGCARLFDWAGLFDSYNQSTSEEEADGKAIFADWAMVGWDILAAMNQCDNTEAP